MSDRDQLISFGFAPDRVEWALRATGGRGLQPAMDFILENEGNPIPDLAGVSETKRPAGGETDAMDEDDEDAAALRAVYGGAGASSAGGETVAQSIKCAQCGKIFRDTTLANFHAEKSGHDQFEESAEEIKPLTEEEKKERLAELRERMAEKRARKAIEDAKEQKANEALRRKAGKDMGSVKEDMKKKQADKEAQQRKQDKIDEAKAKAAIKAQIEIDKRERAEKIAREKAIRDGKEYIPGAGGSSQASTPAAAVTTERSGVKGSEYKETRLQIRLATGGAPLTTTLPSDKTLQDVAEFVASQVLTLDVDTITFASQFPRKVFTRAEFSKTLKDLGLTPSAVLNAS